MAKSDAVRMRELRARRKVLRQQQIELMLEVVEGLADGSNGITCTTTTDLWGITFDWGGEQSAYDALEVRANALGFTIGAIFDEMEQMAVKQYQNDVNAKQGK